METPAGTETEKSCCAKGRCGCKALAAVALLAAGGLGGYFAARHCAAKGAAASAPASASSK